ncbi:MAG: type B 50S ribosomal protein L31 [Planctomycetota bacterium]
MKKDIHPNTRPVVFEDTSTGTRFKTLSSVKAEQTVELDGGELPLVRVDVTSASHPFYTGQQRILDTAGRVEKFGKKFGSGLKASKLLKKGRGGEQAG